MFSFLYRKKFQSFAVSVVVLSVVFGTAAGFVGGLMGVNYLYPISVPESTARIMSYSQSEIGEDVVRPSESVNAAAQAQVLFFGSTKGNRDGFLWPTDALAAGTVLTSDGWLITYGDWLDGTDGKAITAVINSKTYLVTDSVLDSGSGIAFLKVDAVNLPIVGFNESSWLEVGEPVFVYDSIMGLRRFDVIGYGPFLSGDRSDMNVSSDRKDKHLLLPLADGILPGTMVLNRQGQVVAIFSSTGKFGSSAVPIRDFSGQLEAVVREGKANRPFFGANYVDLSRLFGDSERRGGHEKGALLVPNANGSRPAVIVGGPAAEAGLRGGDVILAVNGEEISAKRSLADLVGDYRSGDKLTVSVLRGAFSGAYGWTYLDRQGLEMEVTVTLGRLP